MYGYAITFIIVFLTHPGVIYNFFDPGIPGAIFHAGTVLLLQMPSDSSAGFSYTMSIIYWFVLGAWAYLKVRSAMMTAGVK